MTKDEWALFVRRAHYAIGIPCIVSVVFAPVGIWLIRRGKRQYAAITALPDAPISPSRQEAIALGLASSWDDVAGTTLIEWTEDNGK